MIPVKITFLIQAAGSLILIVSLIGIIRFHTRRSSFNWKRCERKEKIGLYCIIKICSYAILS